MAKNNANAPIDSDLKIELRVRIAMGAYGEF